MVETGQNDAVAPIAYSIQVQNFCARLPLGVTVENYSDVKRHLDQLYADGVQNPAQYLKDNPDVLYKLVRSIVVMDVNASMLALYRVDSIQEYLSLYDSVEEWETTGWAESYFAIINSLMEGQAHIGEYSDVAADGTSIEIGFTAWVLDGHENNWDVVISTHDDITRRKSAESRIRASEARLQALFNNAPEGVFFKDADGRYEMVNRTFANRLGYDDVSSVVGKTVFDLYPHHDAEMYRDSDIECMSSGKVSTAELDIPLPNGAEIIQLAIKFPIMSDDGEAMGVGGIDIDVTNSRQLDRLKSEFISTVSHELRTPLTSIKGSLGLVVGQAIEGVPAELATMLGIAYQNTNQLITLVNDILDMEKIASGSLELDMQRIDLSALVTEAMAANQGFAEEFGERLLPGEITTGLHVEGDTIRLNQVVSNLVSNAVKFSPEGSDVIISIIRRKNHVQVSVTDQGAGIPPEFRDHIFERFTQTDSSDTRKIGGTGLGLSITKSLVEKHYGFLNYSSEVDVGTTFFFTLPLVD